MSPSAFNTVRAIDRLLSVSVGFLTPLGQYPNRAKSLLLEPEMRGTWAVSVVHAIAALQWAVAGLDGKGDAQSGISWEWSARIECSLYQGR
ncbi:hypothetical protein AGR1B_Lc10730 [Agrobacterium fabacearum S56]|nr:hypothetical protein AGR1B_Lc10730 [Agrobacterium fabacearum S56]